MRIWWAGTTATEEYEDALLEAFADGVPAAERAGLPDSAVVLPFANLRRGTGDRRTTGLTGALLAEPVEAPLPADTGWSSSPDGDAEGARGEPPPPRRRAAPRGAGPARAATVRRRGRPGQAGGGSGGGGRTRESRT